MVIYNYSFILQINPPYIHLYLFIYIYQNQGPYVVNKDIKRQAIKPFIDDEISKKIQIAPMNESQYSQYQQEVDPRKSKQMLGQEYDTRSIRYSNEEYSFLSNQMLSRFAQIESASNIATAYPLFKMLRGVSRKLMFNELEIIFFLHNIEDQKWKFEDPLIKEFAESFKQDFLSNSEIHNVEAYKRLLLFLLCCGYTIKCFFNDQIEQELILIHDHIQNYCSRDFKKFIDQWRLKNMNGQLKIQPRVINKLYNKLLKIPKDGSQMLQQDYNALVDQIIQISPPYQSQDQKNVKQEQVQKKQSNPQQQQSQQSQQQQYNNNNNYNNNNQLHKINNLYNNHNYQAIMVYFLLDNLICYFNNKFNQVKIMNFLKMEWIIAFSIINNKKMKMISLQHHYHFQGNHHFIC